MTPSPDLIGPVLREYVQAAADLIATDATRIVYIQAGQEVAWDDSCDGQIAGRVVSVAPHVTQARGVGCGVDYWLATFALGTLRCVAVLDDQGVAPTGAQITTDGQAMLDDLAALQGVIQCNPRTQTILMWQPQGPQGGYAGGEWTFVVRINACGC